MSYVVKNKVYANGEKFKKGQVIEKSHPQFELLSKGGNLEDGKPKAELLPKVEPVEQKESAVKPKK